MSFEGIKLTPKREAVLAALGIEDIRGILEYYPYRYEHNAITPFKALKNGDKAVFYAEMISSASSYRFRKNMTVTRFKILVEDEYELTATIFNRPWAKMLKINDRLIVIGRYEGEGKLTVMNYYDAKRQDVLGIIPVYPLKDGIGQNDIRKIIELVLNKIDPDDYEQIPQKYLCSHGLIDYASAIKNIHHPAGTQALYQALARLKYEEFLRFYLALEYMRGSDDQKHKPIKHFDPKQIKEFIAGFGFTLTKDQNQAISEILGDLASPKMMYRLLEGDVGSGKTAVALVALYANYLSGHKGALMAPTEILAVQHYEAMIVHLKPLGVRIKMLSGSTKDKKAVKADLAVGDFDIVIGTHALFYDGVSIDGLGLIITDEQQRFGVKQRRMLKNKGEMPDFLMMSATPIPRTLAGAIYGDMDVSIIETMPAERKGCDTYFINHNRIKDITKDLEAILAEGQQIYIIAAAINKSDLIKAKDISAVFDEIQNTFRGYDIAILHGRMSSEEKDEVMKRFNDGLYDILIATTVVEVGVNVKNATGMVVFDADRFGLSQLHQLRGRIQRGDKRGKFYLLSDTKEPSTIERLGVLVQTNNGFEISVADLKLRGMGDILGVRQSGLPSFVLGDIFKDHKIIAAAKSDAKAIIADDSDKTKLLAEVIKKAQQNYID